ncbi:HpcH/HpaI aldolase/citrate lyase family protein [Paeniglutamicibacter cryotolerans]|uniref:Citrate lyase subunit beta/citryl-CoA lyase n=1 Tax=Paeniglutamicibacter cryotolerans TaxID=670079 RepID=A0A839QGK3_9MICC|nr:CoA ester lyase [Paeniglutamicibacter cryotolerans]MBB2994827.1 citrate lyase subunit beta/citryl-CoA lyase [Paeniglutamicibacter cryotolerans]
MRGPLERGPALLFCPANRPDRYAKALERGDAVILDLEDALTPADRATARQQVLEHPLDPGRTIVRVNPAGTADFAQDLQMLSHTRYTTVMLAKTETTSDLDALAGFKVLALCETALGVLNAPRIAAHHSTVALMWGAEDLIASLGGSSSRNASGTYRDVALHSRSRVLLAAGAHGKLAIDSVFLDIADHPGLLHESRDAVACGFGAKAAIHPGQVPFIREGFAPSAAELELASSVLAAAHGRGVFEFGGRMIDEPLLRHARSVLARSGATPPVPAAPPPTAE